MHAPNWVQNPRNRFALAVALREISFSGGALALATSLTGRNRVTDILGNMACYFIAIPMLFLSLEQFLHGDHVPGIPLERLTPAYVYGHTIWTYIAAAAYAVAGFLLFVGRKLAAQRRGWA
jgi:hypothetical protein